MPATEVTVQWSYTEEISSQYLTVLVSLPTLSTDFCGPTQLVNKSYMSARRKYQQFDTSASSF